MKQRQRAGPGERMSKVDTAWLRMDSASNLMMIIGVWTLRPGIVYADLCRRMEERMLHQRWGDSYDEYCARVPRWVRAPRGRHNVGGG